MKQTPFTDQAKGVFVVTRFFIVTRYRLQKGNVPHPGGERLVKVCIY